MATKRKPTPAQLAARERFAEMVRSGAFKKKAAKRNPAKKTVSKKVDLQAWMDEYERLENENMHSENAVRLADLLGTKTDQQIARQIVKNHERLGYLDDDDYERRRDIYKRLMPKLERLLEPKRNPRKKTVSEKISQLSREGYPQKQAVAIALSEERAGKVRRNPISYGLDGVVNITDTYERSVASSRNLAEHYANQLRMRGRDDIVYVVFGITPQAKAQAGRYRNGVTITLDPRDYEIAYAFHPTQGEISRQLKAQRDAERRAYTRQGMKLKSNPRASNPIVLVTDRKPSKRKANPVKPKDMTVYQVQYRKPGMKLFEPWMTVMYPKMAEDIARRLADEPMAQTWTIKVESIKVKG